MKPATLVALVCILQYERSESFMASGGAARGACSFKRKRGRQQHLQEQQHQRRLSRGNGPSLMQAPGGGVEWEGKLFELDVVEYRMAGQDQGRGEDRVELAAYIGNGKLHPLLTRAESGPRLFFHDEEAPTISLSAGSCHIVRILDEVSYSQRIVEDRIKNPHGEEAEDCFLIEGTLNPALVIRVET